MEGEEEIRAHRGDISERSGREIQVGMRRGEKITMKRKRRRMKGGRKAAYKLVTSSHIWMVCGSEG